jgi:hypothetical protein
MSTIPPALDYDCPFCGVPAGNHCRAHRGKGRELERMHSRRISLVHHTQEIPAVRALCCECGNSRTCKQPRNKRGSWGHPDWHRDIGDLKCSACDRVTVHALLMSEDYDDPDYEEQMQRVALGAETPKGWHWDEDRLRRTYREGNFPRNPYLRHRWRIVDETRSRESGATTVPTLCGNVVDLPPERECSHAESPTDLIAPGELRDIQTEYEDPATGLWWIDMDCVDCCRVSNASRLASRRQRLEQLLAWFAYRPESIEDHDVDGLADTLDRLYDTVRNQTG